jgi:hypothetical protein
MYQNIPPDLHVYSNVELRNPYIGFDATSVLPDSLPGYTPYNIKPLRENYDLYQSFQNLHSSAFPPTPKFDVDPANTLPKLEPLHYREHPNFSYLDNPPPFNQNYDYQVQNRYINGALTVSEGFSNHTNIQQAKNDFRMNLGPSFF